MSYDRDERTGSSSPSARSDKQTRALVTGKIQDNIELIANLVRDTSQPDKRAKGKPQTDQGVIRAHAILTYCALVGGISVARAVSDEQLSQEILKTVAQLLKNPAA
jgi:TetR/AcrR family transcriptional repressor of nem operon